MLLLDITVCVTYAYGNYCVRGAKLRYVI